MLVGIISLCDNLISYMNSIKEKNRVKRKNSKGCLGTVLIIRDEVGASISQAEKPKLVKVHWDNGTLSYLTPESLEAA